MLCFVFSLGCDAMLNITKVELRLLFFEKGMRFGDVVKPTTSIKHIPNQEKNILYT